MKKDQPLLDPNRKTSLVNVDVESESELNKDESQQKEISPENQMATDGHTIKVEVNNSEIEKQIEVEQPPLEFEREDDLISVAYRILPEQKPLLDMILTPWGIFSLVFFFLANAIIFLNVTPESQTATTLNSEAEKSSEVVSSKADNKINPQVSLNQESKSESGQTPLPQKDNSKNFSPENLSSGNQNSPPTTPNISDPLPLPPPPPVSLTTLNSNSTPTLTVNKKSSPYPDLATALLSNLPSQTKDKLTPPPQSSPQKVVSTPPPPIETNFNSSEANNSESVSDDLQYYVVSEFEGIPSFEQIKSIFPNALITNIEKEIKIQLGVFDNEIDANKLVEKLKQQQISASVYHSSDLQ
jgi:hypothetical protein